MPSAGISINRAPIPTSCAFSVANCVLILLALRPAQPPCVHVYSLPATRIFRSSSNTTTTTTTTTRRYVWTLPSFWNSVATMQKLMVVKPLTDIELNRRPNQYVLYPSHQFPLVSFRPRVCLRSTTYNRACHWIHYNDPAQIHFIRSTTASWALPIHLQSDGGYAMRAIPASTSQLDRAEHLRIWCENRAARLQLSKILVSNT